MAAYLNYLALSREVSPSTQNQALNALVFLYAHVLGKPLGEMSGLVAAKKPRRLPSVLTRDEVKVVLSHVANDTFALMIQLMYGTGMRLMECMRLRVMEIDFGYSQIIIRDGKGAKDRVVPLPEKIRTLLQAQISKALALHKEDLSQGFGEVFMPQALTRKYPNASRESRWAASAHPCARTIRTSCTSQYVFPSGKLSADPRSKIIRRHHLHESSAQKAVRRAAIASGINKRISSHIEGTASRRIYSKQVTTSARWRLSRIHAFRRIRTSVCSTGIVRACRCFDNDDLHACPQSRWQGCGQPIGPVLTNK